MNNNDQGQGLDSMQGEPRRGGPMMSGGQMRNGPNQGGQPFRPPYRRNNNNFNNNNNNNNFNNQQNDFPGNNMGGGNNMYRGGRGPMPPRGGSNPGNTFNNRGPRGPRPNGGGRGYRKNQPENVSQNFLVFFEDFYLFRSKKFFFILNRETAMIFRTRMIKA